MSWKAGFLVCAGCSLGLLLGVEGIFLIPEESFAFTSGLTGYALVALILGSIAGMLLLTCFTPRPLRGLRMYVYFVLGLISSLFIVYILFAFVVSLINATAKLIREIHKRKPKNLASRFIAFLVSADTGDSDT